MGRAALATVVLTSIIHLPACDRKPKCASCEAARAEVRKHEYARRVVGPGRDVLDDISADRRAAAAWLFRGYYHGDMEETLKGSLDDPDIIVRLSAAERLFCVEAHAETNAERYRYSEAVVAERKVRDLASAIRGGDLAAQYRATRKMMAFGRPAARALGMLAMDDGAVGLSAQYALQEIGRAHENVPPAWLPEIERKLKTQEVTLRFGSRPFDETLSEMSKLAGISIWKGDYLDRELVTSAFSAENVPVGMLLEWICRENDCRYLIRDRGVVICEQENMWDGAAWLVLDVRDLEAAGLDAQWEKRLKSAITEEQCPWLWDVGYGGWVGETSHGFISLWPPSNNSDPDGRLHASTIVRYLDGLRTEMGLGPAWEPWPSWDDVQPEEETEGRDF
ncbi:MAG: hypothetical protein ACYS9X_01735 [Planctomycetota bacterium]|jgi:hypothetical protein